jgi:PiT family inorganic phosphate transporter
MFLILIFAMCLTLFFSFWNGFTDAAYSISTVIATRTLKPIEAVTVATVCNFIGMLFGSAVALTIGTGIVSENIMSGELIISALIGALIFDVTSSWIYSLPISETHVLIGGLVGAGIAEGGLSVINIQGIIDKVIIPMIAAPFIAILAAFLFGCLIIRCFRNYTASKVNRNFKRSQIATTVLFAVTNGGNAAQKTMGIMTILLIYYGFLTKFTVPFWVVFSAYATLSLGIFLGGWRVVKTMATKITRLKPYQGVSVELVSAIILGATALLGFPMSSTHVVNGSIMGVGMTQRTKAVKWGMTRKIIIAWILSMPLSAVMSFIIFKLIKLII